ncbi:phage tail assembly protein [Jeongeupia sp. USM3]|uniref:phage tail assembly protein n=1 Tax=Jeongeupia sp. USM3 TaxID=1906741 RepID=UPI00089DE73D|nr:phage tail assembly protein [Jeongeupia sp. USM3]AOY00099.1 hypothetical protein BJP62_06325 [Jeongeupia sp. USM3]
MNITVKLSAPVRAHGEEVNELVLRAPTGKDIREVGLPYAIGDGRVLFESAVIAQFAVRLAGVPMSAIDALSPADWQSVMTAVVGFFGQDLAEAAPTS